MSNPTYKIALRRGDCFDFSLTYKADGDLVDLTGYSAEMSIYWPRQADGFVAAPEGNLVIAATITALSGLMDFHVDEVTSVPQVNRAAYQVRLTDPDDHVTTILSGPVDILPDLFEAA